MTKGGGACLRLNTCLHDFAIDSGPVKKMKIVAIMLGILAVLERQGLR